ncbi:MAG: type II toxin-antitoxin system RelE/ParE family toxin [Bacteroidetes bacterium]|nr:type II toxin-antitoxin system RelE/ParE family toxin [Bacteroidota bacterium]
MKYNVSKEASADLENIWLYTFKNWSLEQADRYVQLILDEFSYLSKAPYSGKDRNDIRDGYRSSKLTAPTQKAGFLLRMNIEM